MARPVKVWHYGYGYQEAIVSGTSQRLAVDALRAAGVYVTPHEFRTYASVSCNEEALEATGGLAGRVFIRSSRTEQWREVTADDAPTS